MIATTHRKGPLALGYQREEHYVDKKCKHSVAYLPPAHAVEGNKLQVYYMDETYPVTVARVGSRPLFDPENMW